MKTNFLTVVLFFILLSACSNESETNSKELIISSGPKTYTLTPLDNLATEDDVKIKSWNYEKSTFVFDLEGDSYQLGEMNTDEMEGNCPHFHTPRHISLIIDNFPYGDLISNESFVQLSTGEHYVLALLSGQCNASIKSFEGHVLKKVYVEKDSLASTNDVNYPMIFYNLPKGSHKLKPGDTELLLDFYLTNVNLGEDFLVKVEINNELHFVDKWEPYVIGGLPFGANTVKLTLTDKSGHLIEVPLNPVQQTFILEADTIASPPLN